MSKTTGKKNLPAPTCPKFLQGYLTCALWSSNDESDESGGQPLDDKYTIDDFSDDALKIAIQDCNKFCKENRAAMNETGEADDEQHGHDFWLTRNGHGAGFWDRNYGDVGDSLSEACKKFGEINIYVGDQTDRVERGLGILHFDRT